MAAVTNRLQAVGYNLVTFSFEPSKLFYLITRERSFAMEIAAVANRSAGCGTQFGEVEL